jgi:hypothetical protein
MTGGGRAQTTQDYAVGIGVFLLTVAFVFAYVPTALGTTDAGAGSNAAVADRLATDLVANLSVEGYPTRLDDSAVSTFFAAGGMGTLRSDYDLADTTAANVTLGYANGTAVTGRDVHAGTRYSEQQAATVSRLVVVDEVRYRLVVRVW